MKDWFSNEAVLNAETAFSHSKMLLFSCSASLRWSLRLCGQPVHGVHLNILSFPSESGHPVKPLIQLWMATDIRKPIQISCIISNGIESHDSIFKNNYLATLTKNQNWNNILQNKLKAFQHSVMIQFIFHYKGVTRWTSLFLEEASAWQELQTCHQTVPVNIQFA